MAVAKRAFEAHLQTGNGGNISIRLNQGDRVVIKPSDIGFVECNEDNLLVVDLEQNIVAPKGKPSKDMPFHLGIYKVRPDVNGIVHVHSPPGSRHGPSAGRSQCGDGQRHDNRAKCGAHAAQIYPGAAGRPF